MTLRMTRRAVALCAITAALAALCFAGIARANTTLPGQNGKIAYTTDAFTVPSLLPRLDSSSQTRGPVKCATFPFPASAVVGVLAFDAEFPFDVLNCTAEIATVNPDGTGFTQVTNNAVQDDFPAWLPHDGSRLAYQSLQNEDNCTNVIFLVRGESPCFWNIWSVNPDGSGNTQLTDLTSGVEQNQSPSYSPDGSTIAFDTNLLGFKSAIQKRDFPVDPILQEFDRLGSTIATMPSGGTTVGPAAPVLPISEIGFVDDNTFVSDSQPTYSPDGTQIAFTRMSITDETPPSPPLGSSNRVISVVPLAISSSIYVAPASGGPSHQVESTDACDVTLPSAGLIVSGLDARSTRQESICVWDSQPAWSPDGTKIAVTRTTFPGFLLSLDAASAKAARGNPFSEDADIVAFNSSDGSGEVDLSKATEPVDCAAGKGVECSFDQKPAWAPDGTRIAFYSNRDNSGLFPVDACDGDISLCDDEIWTMSADGSSPAQVTNNDVNDINPDWQSIPIVQPVTPVTPAAPSPVKPKVAVAGVRRACVSRSFHVRFHISTTASTVKSVVVKLDGRKIKSTSKSSFTLRINARKLKSGRHRLTITATNAAGQKTTTHKTFSVCKAAKPRRKAAPRFTG